MEINNSRKVVGLANMPQSTSPKGGHHGQPMSTQNKLFLKFFKNN